MKTTNHLTIDEIIEFVSAEKLNAESVSLFASVNDHIRECSKCFELVKDFQLIYDEFSRMAQNSSFREYLQEEVVREKKIELENTEKEG